MRKILFLSIITLALFSRDGKTQETPEPLFDKLKKTIKKEYFNVGLTLQAVFDFQKDRIFAGNNGFNIANARVNLSGELDMGFGYFVQTNFISSTPILDAEVHFSPSSAYMFKMGLFKAPFSKEFLTPAPSIDFVNRSQIVSALAPGRQMGFQISGWLNNRSTNYRVGIFNGNGFDGNNNDDNNFLYAARVAFFPNIFAAESEKDQLEFGINAAYSEDSNVNLLGGLLQRFTGERILLGGDVRLTKGPFLISGEYIYSFIEFPSGSEINPYGFHATIGYMVSKNSQILFRWDKIVTDEIFLAEKESDLLIIGYNWFATKTVGIQFNYVIETEESDLSKHQLLVNTQIAF